MHKCFLSGFLLNSKSTTAYCESWYLFSMFAATQYSFICFWNLACDVGISHKTYKYDTNCNLEWPNIIYKLMLSHHWTTSCQYIFGVSYCWYKDTYISYLQPPWYFIMDSLYNLLLYRPLINALRINYNCPLQPHASPGQECVLHCGWWLLWSISYHYPLRLSVCISLVSVH